MSGENEVQQAGSQALWTVSVRHEGQRTYDVLPGLTLDDVGKLEGLEAAACVVLRPFRRENETIPF